MVNQLVKERRRGDRANRILSIEYRPRAGKAKSADKVWRLSTTQNVGSGRLSFYSDHEYRIDDVLDIRLVMGGVLDVFKGIAKVIRVERKQMAASYLTAVRFVLRTPKPRIDRARAPVLKPRNRI